MHNTFGSSSNKKINEVKKLLKHCCAQNNNKQFAFKKVNFSQKLLQNTSPKHNTNCASFAVISSHN